MNIVFMGTPNFSLPTLKQLYESNHDIQLVVTQPNRPKGRGRESSAPPVKRFALEKGLTVLQPEQFTNPEVVNTLRELNADVFIVVAFGQILKENLINLPRHFCINLHASILPKYRGAAPINWAIINGETETGVTTMKMDTRLDTGDILSTSKVPIKPEDDAQSLHDTLAGKGASLVLETLRQLDAGTLRPIPQDSNLSSYAPKLNKEDGLIHWDDSALKIHNRVRGLSPWPGAFSYIGSRRFCICKTEITTGDPLDRPGIIVRIADRGIEVGTRDGRIIVTEIQLEGKKRMGAKSFLAGNKLATGEKFDDQPCLEIPS